MNQKGIERLLETWLTRLGLTHWKVRIEWDGQAADNTEANVERAGSYDEAKLYLDAEYPGWTPQKAEHVIVHELVHLITRDMEYVAEATRAQLPRTTRAVAEAIFDHELEGVIDRVTAALVAIAPRADA